MGVVRREGKWTLEKEKDGLYAICRRKQKVAEIVTDDYVSEPFEFNVSMVETIQVSDFKAAENAFKDYIDRYESMGGLGFW